MRILVTGSSGQLGRTICQQLRPAHEVLGLDIKPGPATTRIGDVTDRAVVGDLIEGADAVIHTVSLHAPDLPRYPAAEFRRVNVEGTRQLLEAAARASTRRIVYTSTTSIYGHRLQPVGRAVWVTEELLPEPRDIYDETKLAAEELCRQFADNEGLSAICLRPGRYFPEEPNLLATYRLYRGVDVRDAAAAHVLALGAPHDGFAIFNVSALSPFDPSDLEELYRNAPATIGRYFPGAAAVFRERGWRLPLSIDRVYVIERAQMSLGYQPKYNFAEILTAGLG
ncbi:MAG TPA: NAD(P)-dependent oxidoreductase [Candidatus Dormibacteraeota bacterium]|jgi:nucleoside-diphosphate-sugar epimerase|nr:NAD(P)-dependent oxidoreductase [Candidatus Dormibacteraeota bacterium]